MTLQTLEKTLLSTSNELFLLRLVTTVDTEADVHTAADAFVWYNLVNLRVLVQGSVNELCLLVGDLFLTANLLSTELRDKISHDLTCDPEVEDGESVIEGVVLGDSGIV